MYRNTKNNRPSFDAETGSTEYPPSGPMSPLFSPGTPIWGAISAADPREALASWFREGSVRGSVFNLCSATLGAGALSLPFAFSKSGWLLGLLMLIIGAFATIFSIHLLIKARQATGCLSYEDLTVNIFGRVMGFIVELNILVFCFGTAVAYIIAVGDILEPVLIMTGLDRQILGIKTKETSWMSSSTNNHVENTFSPSPKLKETSWMSLSTNNHVENTFSPSSSSSSLEDGLTSSQIHTLRVLSMVTFFTLIMFPLSLLEKINSLRFTSFFGVAAIIYLVFSTGLSSVQYLIQFGYTESWGKAPMFIMDGFRLDL